MPLQPIELTSGDYQAKSVIANCQRCVNLYPEANPANTKPSSPVTHYTRPGKRLIGAPLVPGAARGLYTASNGDLYCVIGGVLYYIDPAWNFSPLGQIDADRTNPVSMADNGVAAGNTMVLVDGSTKGYEVVMTTKAMTQIVDPTGLFTGADVVAYLQTFFMFNTIPNTQNWIISKPDSVTFDPLDIAGKATYPDSIASIGVRQREVWLVGTQTTEPWFLSGAADFPFEAIPSTFVSYGCVAKYSVVYADVSLFWISKNWQGKGIIVKSEGYAAQKVSTFALENELQKYATIEDAVASTYQVGGHTFVVFTFPTANKTWAYDLATKQWHQLAWTDDDGKLQRDRVLFYAVAYGVIVGIDWETGKLYQIDPEYAADDVTFDESRDITCIRGMPSYVVGLNRVTHWALRVQMDTGTETDPNEDAPILNMVYSDNGGHTWSTPMQTSLGKTGEYDTTPQFNRLGMARNRVYELFWATKMRTALNQVWVDPEEAES